MREFLLAAALMAAFSCPALAAPCLPRAELKQRLALQYQENPAFAGVASSGALLRVYVRRDGSTLDGRARAAQRPALRDGGGRGLAGDQ